jgi:NADPH:quinone reductase-like Zn-dependent oxidoreductase
VDSQESGDSVRAIVREWYGPPEEVLELRDVEMPTIGDGEVLVRVRAASVNAGDPPIVKGSPYVIRPVYGVRRPRRPVIGQDLAGTVERVGAKVSRFSPGDEVFGAGFGAFAEYAAAPDKRLAHKSPGLGFNTAAAVPIAGLTALQGLRDAAGVEAGQRVLVNGASGGVGTYAVQVAKALGAEVTAVCSTRNVDQATAIGADHVIDYTKEDFTASAARYDVIFDNAASHSLAATLQVLTDRGILIPNAGMLHRKWLANLPRMFGAATSTIFSRKRARFSVQAWRPDDLLTLAAWIEAGTVTPVIERTYPLSDTPQAVAYVGEGHARGKVVITV